MDTRFLGILSTVAFASFAQGTPFASVFGIKTGFALATVFFAAFFIRSFSHYAALVFLSVFVIFFPVGISLDAAYIALVFLSGYFVCRASFWQPWLSYPVSLLAATVLSYALVDFRFLIGHPGIVFQEGAYTVIFGVFLYLLITIPHDLSRRHTF